jgi:FMN phosphatase YigB (HAD superfamily)
VRIGIDFDNTIVCYDRAFHAAAVERGLVPEAAPSRKQAIRDHLRETGQEPAWTELQGYIYGAGMALASPYPGALEFIERCVRDEIDLCIISHKTRTPYLGDAHDLHAAAYAWLESNGVFGRIGLPRARVFFELTKDEKLARIAAQACTVFVDDLPELLCEPAFPKGVRRILFDPYGIQAVRPGFERIDSWAALTHMLLQHREAAR